MQNNTRKFSDKNLFTRSALVHHYVCSKILMKVKVDTYVMSYTQFDTSLANIHAPERCH